MKSRPILFSAPMVRAILDGRKTVTRRVMNPQLHCYEHGKPVVYCGPKGSGKTKEVVCPYGTVGDRLWVRETWAAAPTRNLTKPTELTPGEFIEYRATYSNDSHFVWRPSIFMPRWASRITLEITWVRVERLQDITHHDALEEGVDYDVSKEDGAPLQRFKKLWHEINGKTYPWDTSPWVWVVSFRRVEAP